MSWDVLITAKGVATATKDSPLPSMGSAEIIRAKISKSLPGVDWSQPDWGVLRTDAWSIEFNHQKIGAADAVMLHVRGNGDPLPAIVKLCKENGWEAFDTSADELINLDAPSTKSFKEFQEFRNQITTSLGQPNSLPPVSHRIGYASASLILFAIIIYLLWRK